MREKGYRESGLSSALANFEKGSIRVVFPILLAAFAACDSKKPSSPAVSSGAPTTHWIHAGSGGVAGDTAGAYVAVPPGAVPRDIQISLDSKPSDANVTPGIRVVGKVWTFTVDGQEHFRFMRPVRLVLPFDPSFMVKDSPVWLSVWQEGRWQKVPGARAQPQSGQVVAEVDHFSQYAPTQDGPASATEAALEAARKRLLDNEFWYGTVLVAIRGSGGRQGSGGVKESFEISRKAEVKFRVRAVSSELTAVTGLDHATSKSIKLPPGVAASAEQIRNQRRWVTDPTNRAPEDETDAGLAIDDRFDRTLENWGEGGRTGPDTVERRTLKGGPGGRTMAIHGLSIDVAQGTYSLTVDKVDAGRLELTESRTGSAERKTSQPAMVRWQLQNQKLPQEGTVLTGQMPIPEGKLGTLIGDIDSRWSFQYGSVRGTIAWTLSPAPLEAVELVFAPEGYDDWLPRGGRDEAIKGNSIRVKAILRHRGGGGSTLKMRSLDVRFGEVSREPGVCLNLPLGGGVTSPDLRFAEVSGAKISEEGTHLHKEGPEFTELSIEVDCFDWGAWGSLVAQALLTDGRLVWATVDGDPATPELRLPKRDPKSKVADRWKKEMHAEESKDDEDMDKQTGNKSYGDGLTLYEEYRGLIAKGKHTRDHPVGNDGVKPLTPQKKDLIVHNTIKGVASIRKGLDLFEKASGIHVVEVDDGELPESRQVNVNLGSITAGPQFGLRLVNEAAASRNALGEAQPAHQRVGQYLEASPRGWPKIVVDLASEKQNYESVVRAYRALNVKMPFTLDEAISSTVAHELAHGLGVRHHGDSYSVTLVKNTVEPRDQLKVYDRDGSEIPLPFEIHGAVGHPGNDSSGDVNCIMCYRHVWTWCYRSGDALYAEPLEAGEGKIFCTSSQGTGPNAPRTSPSGKRLPGVYGNADLGNCLNQMRVKDQTK